MADTVKMPNGGYDIKVVRKDDIIKCIDTNILDKELMLTFISQFEVDATNFLSQGRWTNLPYIGGYKKNEFKERINSPEVKELIETAKENFDKKRYIIFRKELRNDIAKSIKHKRIFSYTLSRFVTKNKPFFDYLIDTKGENIARVICYTYFNINTK